ncbi:PAS domain-containing sensor histidine kinase [Aquabacterium sp.]|uniref:PAS domain-containing sensor histidine kinase n=1 Tax=Aquabacterium sp. TaxID=1872578 RepID=UPI002BC15FB9|nr:ATP-binding protein [Aquabacterium sp.]HSW06908.1 ATP-binding protein [Aquabacterium sp.]
MTPFKPAADSLHESEAALCRAQTLAKLAHVIARPDGSFERWSQTLTHGQLRWFGMLQDITERREAEAPLREAAARYRQLFDANPHPMWIHDSRTLAFLAVNDAAVSHYGYRRDEWLSMTVDDVRVTREPASAAPATAVGEVKPPSQQQHRVKDERLIDVEVTAQPIDFQGRSACVVLAHDVTEQRRDAWQVLASREALRALVRRLQHAQEEERTRVAREIHDELGQLLTGLKMDLRWLERKLSSPGLPPAMNALLDRTVAASVLNEQTITTVQKLAAELRPASLDQLGLAAALAQRARQFQQRTGVLCSVHWSEAVQDLAPAVATELFYICQEALTNVTRHAQATRVAIRLAAEDGGLRMEVEDDGRGIDPQVLLEPRSLGLLGMRERAAHCGGTVLLEAGAQGGTRVVVRIPFAPPAEEAA